MDRDGSARKSYDSYPDVEINGAGSVLGSAPQTLESFLEIVAKASVDNGYHGSKADNLSSSLKPSSFEKQNGRRIPLSARGASESNKISPVKQSVPYFKLFKYADRIDTLLMSLGTIMAILDGFVWPAMALIQARLLNKYAPNSANQSPIHVYDEVCRVSYMVLSTLFLLTVVISIRNLQIARLFNYYLMLNQFTLTVGYGYLSQNLNLEF